MAPSVKIVRTAKKGSKPDDATVPRSISIRMYNVGFGDAFLVQIPGKVRPYRILFDCGSLRTNGPSMDKVVTRILEDCSDGDTVRIDLVVATHRHKDHVSGFANQRWADVEVGEVWMPWTEDPKDPGAKNIRDAQSGLAAALDDAIKARIRAEAPSAASLQPSLDLVALALANEVAMDTLHHGFSGTPRRRFLPEAGMTTEPLLVKGAPGVRFYVLGPSRDEAVIRDLDPPKGESYLTLRAGLKAQGQIPEPFSPDWTYTPFASGVSGTTLSDDDRKTIEAFSDGLESEFAVALDKAINGTSLMIMLVVGRTHLLFPGDAQWGTWNAALNVPEWKALLEKTAFYKVGHHGSHNATPREFVESILPEGGVGMVSACRVDQWPGIPKPELIKALRKKIQLVSSDQKKAVPSFSYPAEHCIEARIPI